MDRKAELTALLNSPGSMDAHDRIKKIRSLRRGIAKARRNQERQVSARERRKLAQQAGTWAPNGHFHLGKSPAELAQEAFLRRQDQEVKKMEDLLTSKGWSVLGLNSVVCDDFSMTIWQAYEYQLRLNNEAEAKAKQEAVAQMADHLTSKGWVQCEKHDGRWKRDHWAKRIEPGQSPFYVASLRNAYMQQLKIDKSAAEAVDKS